MADFQRKQQQQMIDRDVALLVQRRFRAEIFTVDNINRAGFTTNQFMNHMHDLTRRAGYTGQGPRAGPFNPQF
jgi:hypothetical protein